ncbi:SDR family oxidoreductase [Leptolyngbya sp. FACHB-36]|uniref:SDR family oxidoreductase n=1 Tax=Leptolyngbya sp. FACHB-36 TaxID=2692808 RepID=UPI001680A6DA|nr:SDR family oxidoreductase [Leptolyngbya sp. FACHB-36]MBD2022608.1 SDR family oxidoreductase [Leptolyngbya sp. FACHB-36]
MTQHIFLAGASRGVGRELAKLFSAEKIATTAMLRSDAAHDELTALSATVVMGDALDFAQVEQAISNAGTIDAVISTIGGKPTDGERADFKGNKHLIDAAVKAGVQRFLLVSSIGTGESAAALPPQALETLGAVLAEKEQAENHLTDSGLIYTIVRPGGLKSEVPKGQGILVENPLIAGSIYRADVARLVYRCLQSERAHNKILSAVDRTMVYGQPEIEEFVP